MKNIVQCCLILACALALPATAGAAKLVELDVWRIEGTGLVEARKTTPISVPRQLELHDKAGVAALFPGRHYRWATMAVATARSDGQRVIEYREQATTITYSLTDGDVPVLTVEATIAGESLVPVEVRVTGGGGRASILVGNTSGDAAFLYLIEIQSEEGD